MIKITKTERKTAKHYLSDGSYLMNSNFKQGYPYVTIRGCDKKDCIILEEGLKIPNGEVFSITDNPAHPYLDTKIEIEGDIYYTNRGSVSDKYKDIIIPMSDMKPVQIGVIVGDTYPSYKGHYIMRTYSHNDFEVIDLSKSIPNICWTNKNCSLKVRLLNIEEKITLELSNT